MYIILTNVHEIILIVQKIIYREYFLVDFSKQNKKNMVLKIFKDLYRKKKMLWSNVEESVC